MIDPDETLERIRHHANHITADHRALGMRDVLRHAVTLAEHVKALDDSLAHGGLMPGEWVAAQRWPRTIRVGDRVQTLDNPGDPEHDTGVVLKSCRGGTWLVQWNRAGEAHEEDSGDLRPIG